MVNPSVTVTLLFTDIEGVPRLWEADYEAMDEALARHDAVVRKHVEGAGGRVFKTRGDAFCAVFSDACDAVAAAVAAQRALGAESWLRSTPIGVRMALHSGSCVERDGDYFGRVVNRAARLLAVAHGGQVLFSEATYELIADRLGHGIGVRDLGVHWLKDLGRPERVYQLSAPGLLEEFGPLRSLDDPDVRHNLPSQTSSFVGRAVELAELRSLVLGGSRLVTLTGAGGAGKTRLALQVAAEAVDGMGDGVWLVELAPLADPELVARTVAAVLGVREEAGLPMLDTLAEAVADRYLLILLDNAEHVLGSTAKLADALLRSCPRVCLLATSREPLGISGEHVFRVPSLSVPPAEIVAPEQLATFEAVQLFVERASLQRPGFSLDEANAAAVGAVCARLDGIPLAIELAAARLGSLSVSEINSRLDQRLRLLTGGSRSALPRQQTLRALIDWSYDLLNAHEQLVLDRLSVFAGGWTLEAAETVTAGGDIEAWQVLDHLAALVAKSLVQADEIAGSTRYRLLETVRHYAAERLAHRTGSDLDATRRAHRDHYLALVETAKAELHGAGQLGWLDRLEVEFDNIRAALAFSVADPGSAQPGLRLAVALRWFCDIRGHGGEVLDALSALLKRADAHQPTLIRAQALTVSCQLLDRFADYSTTFRSSADEAIDIARSVGDDAATADALLWLSRFDYIQGDLPTALARIDEAVGLARAIRDPHLTASTISQRAVFRGERGDWSAAFADYEEALALSRAAGDRYRLAITLNNLGVDRLAVGELQAARAHLEEATALARDLHVGSLFASLSANLGLADIIEADPGSARRHFIDSLATTRLTGAKSLVPNALLGLALAASADSGHTLAATLHGVADEHLEQAGRTFEALEAGLRDHDHDHLRATMGDNPFDAAYQHGRTLSQADAISLATAAEEPETSLPPDVTGPTTVQPTGVTLIAGLSEREREVLALLANGSTDAKIAEQLFVSISTVRSHLDRIRDKTGARRRVELARYAVETGIV